MALPSAKLDALGVALKKATRAVEFEFGKPNVPLEMKDMLSIAHLELIEVAERKWRPNLGDLWAYAERRVLGAVRNAVRWQRREGRVRLSEAPQSYECDMALAIDLKRAGVTELSDVAASASGWTVAQVAQAAKVSEQAIRKMIAKGTLYAVKTKTGYRVPDGMAAGFIQSRQ